MKNLIIMLFFLIAFQAIQARIRYIDKNGGTDQYGHSKYTTIQAGIDAAIEGDTVRIFPGIYNESITIGKNIVVQGGGLSTILTCDVDVAVKINGGKLMWVYVKGVNSDGIQVSNATVTNCIISGCTGNGISVQGANCKIVNCISQNNNGNGFWENQNSLYINCIAVQNIVYGFHPNGTQMTCQNCDAFGNQSNFGHWYVDPIKFNCYEEDPGFSSDGQFRINNPNSNCKKGLVTIFNLDGTPSEMGYYGGPDAPLLPYITTPQNFILNPDGSMQFNLTGKVGY